MTIRIFNTLTKQEETFTPLSAGRVSFYHCGPTVYWTQHIGNMRGMILADLIRRSFAYLHYDVSYVRNYTDVGHLTGDNDGDADTGEDRMEKASKRENKSPEDIANFYITQFEQDTAALNILPATEKPKATEYIKEMQDMVQVLLDKGIAYQTPLAIYFDTSKTKDYYALSGQSAEALRNEAGQGDVSDREKRNPTDFALWFFKVGVHKRALQTWTNPFSETEGFPGWHIECSTMAKKLLGDTIDLHMGGIEHIPIHHTNEIAQSECANDTKFVNYWLHNEHLLVDGSKMSKSEGTGYALSEITDKGYSPLDLRYFFLQAHYRSKQNFTWEALEAAQRARTRLVGKLAKMDTAVGNVDTEYKKRFTRALEADFGLPEALAVTFDVLKSDLDSSDKKATILDFDQVLGLNLEKEEAPSDIPAEITQLADERAQARADKDWARSDELRDQIASFGYEVKDTPNGQLLSRNS